ncbi:MAG: MerR family transcriptional regulator [Cumulibacter sp.]
MTERTQVMTTWTVGKVAETFGVTVRTLHHYDDIGLLRPSERSSAGYRIYTDADLQRLQQIVVYRRLEMPLEKIADLLNGDTDPAEHLRRQRATVMSRLGELNDLVQAIDRALEKEMSDEKLSPSDLKELFGDGFEESYQTEAEERWGDSEAWAQSQRRTANYTRADWEAVKAEQDALNKAFTDAWDSGLPATSEQAMAAAEMHRASVQRFYDCDYGMQRCLADMFVQDERFAKTYNDMRDGLAPYVRDAIYANAERKDDGQRYGNFNS